MPPSKSAPTVFYARDKSPFEEHNSPRASIEDGDTPMTNVVSDVVDDSESEEFQSPGPDYVEQGTAPEKRSLSPGEESDDEGVNEQSAPAAKRQRRSQANNSAAPRRSKRISSTAPVKGEKPATVSASGKKRRGRPPIKSKTTSHKSDVVAKRGPGRPPGKGKVTHRESTTEWEVERVLDSQVDAVSKELFYLVKWKGFGNKENTWESKKNLAKCSRLIRDFEKKH